MNDALALSRCEGAYKTISTIHVVAMQHLRCTCELAKLYAILKGPKNWACAFERQETESNRFPARNRQHRLAEPHDPCPHVRRDRRPVPAACRAARRRPGRIGNDRLRGARPRTA